MATTVVAVVVVGFAGGDSAAWSTQWVHLSFEVWEPAVCIVLLDVVEVYEPAACGEQLAH